jgi:hypothetical protein
MLMGMVPVIDKINDEDEKNYLKQSREKTESDRNEAST